MDLGRVAAHEPTIIADEDRDAAVLVPVVQRADIAVRAKEAASASAVKNVISPISSIR